MTCNYGVSYGGTRRWRSLPGVSERPGRRGGGSRQQDQTPGPLFSHCRGLNGLIICANQRCCVSVSGECCGTGQHACVDPAHKGRKRKTLWVPMRIKIRTRDLCHLTIWSFIFYFASKMSRLGKPDAWYNQSKIAQYMNTVHSIMFFFGQTDLWVNFKIWEKIF